MASYFNHLYQRFRSSKGQRIYIIPTRFGFIYAAFLLLILVGAINYNNSLGHTLCFLLASMGWVGMHHTYRNIAKLTLVTGFAEPSFLGHVIHIQLHFANTANANSYHIEVSSKPISKKTKNPFKRIKGFDQPAIMANIDANDSQILSYPIASIKRGYQPLGELRVASTFPLGLFSSWRYFKTDITALVYPKPEGDLPLPRLSSIGKQSLSHTAKGTDDFANLNTYREGDPLKAIAWKALARDDILRVKQFSGYQGGELILSWYDLQQIRDLEARLSQLCQWVLEADKTGLHYGLILPNQTVEKATGQSHRQHCLTLLALYHNDND